MKHNSRAISAEILKQVINNGSTLEYLLPQVIDDKPFVQTLCYGTLRYYFQLKLIASQLIKKPFRAADNDIYALILIGLYQLIHLNTENFAAVNECVDAAKQLKKPWASAVINGTLRNFQRNAATLIEKANASQEGKFAHPMWMVETFQKDWKEKTESILIANNQKPPMTLRVNTQKMSRDDYLKQLHDAEIIAAPCEDSAVGITLKHPCAVDRLPNFFEGACSVQDEAPQLAIPLLHLKPYQTVLDACAAPGGKSCHILEAEPTVKLMALDINEERTEKIHENLTRLQLSADVVVGDALHPDTWANNMLFDRILLDAPCSASGVIRRHPEIKLLRKPKELAKLANTQYDLLCALWTLLKPEGIFLYATCSVFREENSQVIERFLKNHPEAKLISLNLPCGINTDFGTQLLPDKTDGFFYAGITK